MIRTRRALAASVAALLGAGLLAPAGAAAQSGDESGSGDFPIYGEDKFLGAVNEFDDPMFTELFNQVAPENAGKWGVAAGSTQSAPMRWERLDDIYEFAQANDFPMRFHTLLWGNQQPTWMRDLPPEEQLEEIEKWFAAVAERYPDLEWIEVVNEPTWDPPDCDDPKNAGDLCTDAGNYLDALGGYNGTDGTGWDWILNAFRLARQYFPDTKLMINDVLITNSHEATTDYLEIIEVLQSEDLVDGIGLQGHVHVTTEGVPGPTVWRRDWAPEEDMSVHEANLDRLAATGLPIQVTELELDGADRDGVPGDEVQLADYRRVVPTFWEHPAVEGITLWGWHEPSHWRNSENAPIVRSNGELKPAAHWLFNYVNGVAPVIEPGQSFALDDSVGDHVGTVKADDWASEIGRPDLRTFTWEITGGTGAAAFSIEPSTGDLSVDPQHLDPEASEYSLEVRVSDGFHTSDEVGVTIVGEDPGEPGAPRQRLGFFLNNDWDTVAEHEFMYGRFGDEVLIGDWDGDGTDSIIVRRGQAFYVSNAPQGGPADEVFAYGRPGDTVLVGDWDGDGRDTLAVRRGAQYYVANAMRSGPADEVVVYGRPDDQVVVGDWDADARDTFAVRRGGQYFVKNTIAPGVADEVVVYGRPGDVTLAGDWDGDGDDTFAVRRGAQYFVKNTIAPGGADIELVYGQPDDEIYVGDWDGDSTDTLGVRRLP